MTKIQSRLWDPLARPINHNPNIMLRSQDMPPVYEENSCIYIFSEEIIRRRHNRVGDRPYLFEMSKEESQDIDWPIDFELAEYLFKATRDS